MIQAVFERKPDFRLRDVVIETVIRLPKEEYEQFLSSPCDSYEFIEKNSKPMLMDEKNGVFYCMLVTGEGYRDGVFVEAEGYPYARYASYVPDATALCYDSLSKVNGILAKAVEEIVEEGTNKTTTGNWMTDRSKVETLLGEGQSENPRLWKLLQDMLRERQEVSLVDCMEEGFDIYYYLDFCPNYIPEEGEAAVQEAGADVKSPRLKDILCTHWENIHLVHTEVDNVPHTIAELDSGTLTEAGKKDRGGVLN